MKPRLRIRADGSFQILTHDGYVPFSVSGLRAPASSWSGSTGRMSQDERPVFIIRSEVALLPALQAPVLNYAKPHTLAPWRHEPHGASFPKANHDLTLSHDGQTATL